MSLEKLKRWARAIKRDIVVLLWVAGGICLASWIAR